MTPVRRRHRDERARFGLGRTGHVRPRPVTPSSRALVGAAVRCQSVPLGTVPTARAVQQTSISCPHPPAPRIPPICSALSQAKTCSGGCIVIRTRPKLYVLSSGTITPVGLVVLMRKSNRQSPLATHTSRTIVYESPLTTKHPAFTRSHLMQREREDDETRERHDASRPTPPAAPAELETWRACCSENFCVRRVLCAVTDVHARSRTHQCAGPRSCT